MVDGNAIKAIDELGKGAVKNNFGKGNSVSIEDKAFKRKINSIEEVVTKLGKR